MTKYHLSWKTNWFCLYKHWLNFIFIATIYLFKIFDICPILEKVSCVLEGGVWIKGFEISATFYKQDAVNMDFEKRYLVYKRITFICLDVEGRGSFQF